MEEQGKRRKLNKKRNEMEKNVCGVFFRSRNSHVEVHSVVELSDRLRLSYYITDKDTHLEINKGKQ